ncbi:hypothetical protein HY448_02080 [Candidatus Pacearchaeota archaeon]|nr:hypothetical protein [Candidatus Pacearchaeota archaeon]
MEFEDILKDHTDRIKALEDRLDKLLRKPVLASQVSFTFSDKSKQYNDLLEELLKSEFCHSQNGLSYEEILEVFKSNGRPVNTKKLRDLLAIWKTRKKIESLKEGNNLRYFWIEHG